MPDPQLSEEQVRAFDTDYFTGMRLSRIFRCIEQDFGDRAFRILDIGCGNGQLVDRILEHFPAATAVAMDNSPYMIEANAPHPRKRTLLADAMALSGLSEEGGFDIVSLNWILHHVVHRSWTASQASIVALLRSLQDQIVPGGRLSVYENCYDGLFFDNLPGWLVHRMTSTPILSRIAKSQGANTAGIGVCFQSHATWRRLLAASGWGLRSELTEAPWHERVEPKLALALHLRKIYCNHFWLETATADTRAAEAARA